MFRIFLKKPYGLFLVWAGYDYLRFWKKWNDLKSQLGWENVYSLES